MNNEEWLVALQILCDLATDMANIQLDPDSAEEIHLLVEAVKTHWNLTEPANDNKPAIVLAIDNTTRDS
jgi:hypothetical protein